MAGSLRNVSLAEEVEAGGGVALVEVVLEGTGVGDGEAGEGFAGGWEAAASARVSDPGRLIS